jgi:hypothetical protein
MPEGVVAAHVATQDAGNQCEDRVGAQMTEVDVDAFEAVEIDDADRDLKTAAFRRRTGAAAA